MPESSEQEMTPTQTREQNPRIARPFDDWHEDIGEVLWWRFPIDEPPYVGSPLGSDWPGYHTHWTVIVIPLDPASGGPHPARIFD